MKKSLLQKINKAVMVVALTGLVLLVLAVAYLKIARAQELPDASFLSSSLPSSVK